MGEQRYRPSTGMLLMLQLAARGAALWHDLDVYRCRKRGLIDHNGCLTASGRQIWAREVGHG